MKSMPEPDFLRPIARPRPLAWAALGVSLCVLGVAAFEAAQAWQARTAAATAAIRPAAAAPAPKSDSAAVRATRQALAQLDRPWGPALMAVEAVQVDGVVWLVLDIGERGVLRLEGQAPDAARAQEAAAALRVREPWSQVLLERIDQSAGGPLRFALVATPTVGSW